MPQVLVNVTATASGFNCGLAASSGRQLQPPQQQRQPLLQLQLQLQLLQLKQLHVLWLLPAPIKHPRLGC